MSYPSPSSGSGGGPWHGAPPGYGAQTPPPPYAPPYGQQSSYGQPQPPYSSPPYGQPHYGQPEPKTNGLAVAALVLGLAAPLGAFVLPVILSLVALKQIKTYGQRGAAYALGGLVATAVWVLIAGAGTTVAVALQQREDTDPTNPPVETTQPPEPTPEETEPPPVAEPERVDANSLELGDCIQDLDNDEGTVTGLPVVPCESPHEGEVFATFDIEDGDWPGQEEVLDESQDGCSDAISDAAPEVENDSSTRIYYLYPTEQSWGGGDRKVICMTFYQDGPRTGSVTD